MMIVIIIDRPHGTTQEVAENRGRSLPCSSSRTSIFHQRSNLLFWPTQRQTHTRADTNKHNHTQKKTHTTRADMQIIFVSVNIATAELGQNHSFKINGIFSTKATGKNRIYVFAFSCSVVSCFILPPPPPLASAAIKVSASASAQIHDVQQFQLKANICSSCTSTELLLF